MSEPGSRWQGSVLTFGPAGRTVCTALLLAVPALFLLWGGLFGVVGAVTWCGWVLPGALRDTWRRVVLPATDLTRLRDATARELAEQRRPRPDHLALGPEAKPPTRW